MSDERTPLLQFPGSWPDEREQTQANALRDHHGQFCHLVGIRPLTLPPGTKHKPNPESLYHRATRRHTSQGRTYIFTATLVNALLLTQVVLGAALTGLGASNSSHILVTIFGALNTVVAGLVAFLKSRGQPMRARMFRDDLERVVDEIENSAVMWLGISKNLHGYDAIDTDDQVTVRSEVARLTRLYDRAVKQNTMNDPDFYNLSQASDLHSAALRSGPAQPSPAAAQPAQGGIAGQMPVATEPAAITPNPDESPATTAPEPVKDNEDHSEVEQGEESQPDQSDGKDDSGNSSVKGTGTPRPETTRTETNHTNAGENGTQTPAQPDPDESPASAAHLASHKAT